LLAALCSHGRQGRVRDATSLRIATMLLDAGADPTLRTKPDKVHPTGTTAAGLVEGRIERIIKKSGEASSELEDLRTLVASSSSPRRRRGRQPHEQQQQQQPQKGGPEEAAADSSVVDYVALAGMMETADANRAAETGATEGAAQQWWRQPKEAAMAGSPFAAAPPLAAPVVYNSDPNGARVRGLGPNRRMQRQRASAHLQRSDVLRFGGGGGVPAVSPVGAKQISVGKSKANMREVVTCARLVEAASQ